MLTTGKMQVTLKHESMLSLYLILINFIFVSRFKSSLELTYVRFVLYCFMLYVIMSRRLKINLVLSSLVNAGLARLSRWPAMVNRGQIQRKIIKPRKQLKELFSQF